MDCAQSTKACFPDKTKAVPLGDAQAEAAQRSTKGGSSGGGSSGGGGGPLSHAAAAGPSTGVSTGVRRQSFARLEDVPLAAGTADGGDNASGDSSLKARAQRRQSRPLPQRFAEADRVTFGVLLKKGGGHSIGGRRSWKRREFRIDVGRHELSWFEPGASKGGGERLGYIPLAGSTLREVVDEKHPFRFQVSELLSVSASGAGAPQGAARAARAIARSANLRCAFVCAFLFCLPGMTQPI
jgi:hypothetical protein